MTLETFFEKFDQFADAPNAVAKMRELVLELAVQGKLTSQPVEISFPQVRLDSLGSWAQGCGFPIAEQGHEDKLILFSKVSDMNLPGNEREIIKTNHTIDEAAAKRLRIKVHPPGTVIFPKIGGAIATNKRRVLVRPTAIDNNCSGIIPNKSCSTPWLFLVLSAIDFAKYQSGTSVPAVNQGALGEIEVSLPPLAEQKRIVAKVDELMALCDRLEVQQKEREEKKTALARASLARFADAPTPANLNFLFHSSFNIHPSSLRQSILTLAVQGKLVPQDPNDESAETILIATHSLFERLVAAKKLSRPKPLPPIADDEAPFSLPRGWAWCRLGQIMRISSGDGLIAKDMNEGTIPVYGGNGVNGYHDAHNVAKRTLVIGRVGFYCGSIHVTPEHAWVTDNAFITTFDEKHIDMDFLSWRLKATDLRERDNATAQPVISGGKVYPTLLALPPLAEQRRIVAKVDQLMALVDELEAHLAASRAAAANLLSALVAELTGTPNDRKFSAPSSKGTGRRGRPPKS
jgi:type I restriction enzyme, S subunit